MKIRWGVSPIAWMNDDMPELGGDTPLEKLFGDCRDIGFEGVELGGKFPRRAEELGPLLGGYGLSLIGGWYSTHLLARDADAEIAAMQDHLALIEAMGCDVFIAAECSNAVHGNRSHPLREQPRVPEGEWARFGERMTRIAEYVQARGMRFAYHYHLGTCVEKPADIEAFVAATGEAAGFVIDTGHAVLGGNDPVELINRYPGRVSHVHAKDIRRTVHKAVMAGGESFLDGVLAGMFTVPGDGSISFGAVMRALKAIDYSGWVVIEAEQDPAVADPKEYATLGLATLKREAALAGFARESA
ncbi:2-keto-myo-inositol dehydratase [Novosphingobium sp. CF614]|uniref:myo-inosose-2 dehydratase n=1 Tax=Novosphingobium sp. CF614 TaxID=1884364 RepID=UPI0008F03B9A|nr:myo-inosose-2 dehydratase [Novosphingobium sp. CF614]SFG07986.1 2-keto-myo-inositol dehydratase [Novosphingobium sp. CF614]